MQVCVKEFGRKRKRNWGCREANEWYSNNGRFVLTHTHSYRVQYIQIWEVIIFFWLFLFSCSGKESIRKLGIKSSGWLARPAVVICCLKRAHLPLLTPPSLRLHLGSESSLLQLKKWPQTEMITSRIFISVFVVSTFLQAHHHLLHFFLSPA